MQAIVLKSYQHEHIIHLFIIYMTTKLPEIKKSM